MSPADWQHATEEALAIFRRRHPDRPPERYVCFDDPQRLSYKRYAAGGAALPILVTAPGGFRPIEADPRSIANNLSTRLYIPRLFVPESIRPDVERALA